jgi:DNA-binding transcriptional regulator of glucitol operon
MGKVRKLTPQLLRRLVIEEKEKYEQDVKKAAAETREVEASEYADTLEKDVDYLALLKIKEVRLQDALKRIQEQKAIVKAKITASRK